VSEHAVLRRQTSRGVVARQTLSLTVAPGGIVAVFFDGSYPTYSKDDGTVAGWQWNVDGAVAATTATFSHAFTSGIYNIGLVVTDDQGLSSTVSATGTVCGYRTNASAHLDSEKSSQQSAGTLSPRDGLRCRSWANCYVRG